jgi:hypothetical protein
MSDRTALGCSSPLQEPAKVNEGEQEISDPENGVVPIRLSVAIVPRNGTLVTAEHCAQSRQQ